MPSKPGNSSLPADVLVVEDDPLIALDVEDTLRALGVSFIRTASDVARALEMIAQHPPEFALLDVGLHGENSFGIAERLAAMNIPFAFVTGYSINESIPPAFADYPRLGKPYTKQALVELLTGARKSGAI